LKDYFMELDVRRLLVLRAVRDAGGVLAAAEVLRVSASAVSQQLSKLEHETGLALVDRSLASRARLTAAGARLAQRADAIAAELSTANREVAELAGTRSRTVRVAAFPSAITTLLVPAAAWLRSAEPRIDVHVVEARDDLATLHAALRSGSLDVVIDKRPGQAELPEGIVETVLRDDPYRVVIPAGWPAPVALTELLDRPWVGHPPASPGRVALDRIERDEGVTLRLEHECTEYAVALALVEAGLAAAIVPELALAADPSPLVRVVDLGDLGFRRVVAHHLAPHAAAVPVLATLDALKRHPAARTVGGAAPALT
jgi:DNA-binding transcriptional LysR family regulator